MKLNKDSIQFKIPFYLFIFVTVMLLFLWISEILLLDTIYRKTKTDTITEVGQYISENINHPEIEIVGINDLCPADYLAYMLKYDTCTASSRARSVTPRTLSLSTARRSPSLQSATPLTCPGARSALSTSLSPPACS